MKKLSALALVAALALTGPALALDATVKAGAAGSAAGSAATDAAGVKAGAGLDATATGSVSSSDNYGTLISTLNAGKGTVDIAALGADADITVVNVSTLKAEGDTTALDNALDKNADARATLHADINANADLKAKLEGMSVDIDSIVAVTTAADGQLTVYVDDRA